MSGLAEISEYQMLRVVLFFYWGFWISALLCFSYIGYFGIITGNMLYFVAFILYVLVSIPILPTMNRAWKTVYGQGFVAYLKSRVTREFKRLHIRLVDILGQARRLSIAKRR